MEKFKDIKTITNHNHNDVIKDSNIDIFKNFIKVFYQKVYDSEINMSELDNILSTYIDLRDELKKQMFQTNNINAINAENIDIHKICACFTISIFRNLKTIPVKYVKNRDNLQYYITLFAYLLSLTFIKSFISKTKGKVASIDIKFNFNSEMTYDEFLYAYIYNNEHNAVINNNIGCLHSLSHIYYLLQELYYTQSICITELDVLNEKLDKYKDYSIMQGIKDFIDKKRLS